ncbi:MAG: ShlB/FhaC/HecB family hemolysin secretion/activation protein [Symploca sp. SIO2G7]|nr:ShlB/FhaC/HecB family hemolysin secretion/activation protein [Symploca sp. SIO2G7]
MERVSAELTAGVNTGTSILTVEIDEAQSFGLPLRVDNSRSPSIGTVQGQISISEGNLLGIGDRVELGYSHTEGNDVFDVSYRIPINPANGTLSISASRTDNDVVSSTFFDIDDDGNGPDIESESTQVEVSYRQPVLRTIRDGQFKELALGLSGSYRESQSFLFDQPFRFSLSSDEDGETKVSALRFFQDYTLQDATQVLALRSQFSLGIDALDSTIQDDIPGVGDIPDSEFFSWRGQAQWVRRLSSDTTLLLRSNLQLANDGLTSSEQFSLGGVGTVRGYRQDQTLTDSGFFASTEVRFPIMQVPEWQGTLQLAPFVDFGVGWNSGDRSAPDDNTLASLGLGLQWLQGDRNQLRARLDWGIPLIPIDDGSSFQEQGFHFSVEYDPF